MSADFVVFQTTWGSQVKNPKKLAKCPDKIDDILKETTYMYLTTTDNKNYSSSVPDKRGLSGQKPDKASFLIQQTEW